MGADSAGVAGLSLRVRHDPKICKVGEFLLGFTTSFRMGQLLAHAFEPPLIANPYELERYMVTDFAMAVRKCFKEHGYAKKENDVESGGTFLVGVRGRLFRVADDYQIAEAADDFDACGCGEDIALGALHALERCTSLSPTERLGIALQAAERYSAGVRGPFAFDKTDGNLASRSVVAEPLAVEVADGR